MAEKKTPAKRMAKAKEAEAEPKGDARPADAIILSYRGGRKTRRTNQMLIEVEGADSKSKASAYIGRRIVWKTTSGKLIQGKITHAHGSKGVLRARFPKGLPGEALGRKAKVC